MTTPLFYQALTAIVADLSRELPVAQRYQRLLNAMLELFPCDAAALLRLDGDVLKPLATGGLSEDAMGRRFAVDEHPRLAHLLHSRGPVRFPADSELPDPYDGLVEGGGAHLHVHDCMGASLYIDDQPWGVLTLDAMQPGTFDRIEPLALRTFISLAEATVKAAQRIDALEAKVEQEHAVRRELLRGSGDVEIVGQSGAIRHLQEEIAIVARSDLSVLVLGETGVGKELVARRIHGLSARAEKPLVDVNCAALPEAVAESELFGHVRGAFTGAVNERAGKFEIANEGTLFLDEIGELPLAVQAKLLRVLQSGEIQRLGSDVPHRVDVRVIAATNRDLAAEVAAGRFRPDLYHRLSVYPISVPPLRERGRDVLLLAGYLLERNQRRLGVRGLRLTASAKALLQRYDWPGNVRELEHLLSRAALKALADQGRDRNVVIDSRQLDIDGRDVAADRVMQSGLPAADGLPLRDAVDQFQRELIREQIARHNGNRAAAARALEIDRGNLFRLMRRLGMS